MSTVFEWLDRASRCGDPTVEEAARVMKDYYQGAEPHHDWAELRDRFKDHPHVHEAGPHEGLARRIQQRKWLREEND